MKQRFFATLFIIIIGTQVFPYQGCQFWYNLIKYKDTIEAPLVQVIQEERFEEHVIKIKQPNSNLTNYCEFQALLTTTNNRIRVILSLGELLDRSDPLLIPPPNQFI
jgi:hypothetical protein